MIQNEVCDWKSLLPDNYTGSICEICPWSHSAHGGPAPIMIMSFCEKPLLAGQEEQEKNPQLTNNSCPNVVLETQDGDSDGYKVRNCAVPLLWQACSSDKPLIPGPEPVIPSPFLSTTFTSSLLFTYFIPLNNRVPWPVKNWEGSYCAAQEGD